MPDELLEVIDDEVIDDDPVELPDGAKPPVEAEPFLKINDRTVYKTPEDAKKGFESANERLGQYRELGSPEEIRAMRAKMAELDRITGRDKGTSENMDDPMHGLDDDQKAQWTAFRKREDKAIRQAGYIHESELPGRIETVVDTRERRTMARDEFSNLAKARGLEVDDEVLDTLEETAGRWVGAGIPANQLTPRQKELNAMYFSTGGPRKFAQLFFERFYGKAPAKPAAEEQPKPDQRQRDANGRYETAKRKTQDLPKNAKTGQPAAEDGGDETKKLRDPKYRLAAARQMVKDRLGLAS
jgi:hypothetical protein